MIRQSVLRMECETSAMQIFLTTWLDKKDGKKTVIDDLTTLWPECRCEVARGHLVHVSGCLSSSLIATEDIFVKFFKSSIKFQPVYDLKNLVMRAGL